MRVEVHLLRPWEIRFEEPAAAQKAVRSLDGSAFRGWRLRVRDLEGAEGVVVLSPGLPLSARWHHVKDHFKGAGEVAVAMPLEGGEALPCTEHRASRKRKRQPVRRLRGVQPRALDQISMAWKVSDTRTVLKLTTSASPAAS